MPDRPAMIAAANLLLAAAYFLLARFALEFTYLHGSISPLWPSSGLAIAALVLGRLKLWPGVFLGALAANAPDLPMLAAVPIAAGNTLEAVAGAMLCRRLRGHERPLGRLPRALRFLLAAALAPVISATVGVASLAAVGQLGGRSPLAGWTTWWSGDMLGVVLFGTVLLAWGSARTRSLSRREWVEAVAIGALTLLVCLLVLWLGMLRVVLVYPLIVWASLRFGLRGGALAALAIVTVAMVAAIEGRGPLVEATAGATVLTLQSFIALCVMLAVLLGTVTEERRRALADARELARTRQNILDSSPMAIVSIDTAGTVTSWNRAAEELFGYREDEVLGAPLAIVPPEEMPHYLRLVELVKSGRGFRRERVRRARRDGELLTLELSVAEMRDDDGAVVGAIGVYEDVTELEQVSAELASQSRRMRMIVESAVDAVVSADERGVITGWDGRAEAIFGWTREEAVGRALTETIIPPAFRARHLAAFERFLQTGEQRFTGPVELTGCRKDGTEFPVELVVSHARLPGGYHFSAFIRDLTDRKAAEAELRSSQAQLLQAQKMEAVGRLAGGVAHDFNNLLTSILGMADLALVELDPESAPAGDITEIKHAAERAAVLTRQLLAFGRRQHLEPRVLDLNGVITALGSMLRPLLGADMRIVLDLDAEPVLMHGDRGQIEQVLMNLAINARDAMPDGGVLTISTSTRVLEEPLDLASEAPLPAGRYAVLRVADTGTGMSEETIRHLFEPFFTTKEPGRGTGLGLSTVYGIVRQHHGGITVRSRPGTGAVFEMLLPAVEGMADEEAAPAGVRPDGGSEVVLLAEDEPVIRAMAERVLARYGYTVLVARDAREALRLAQEALRLDLLVTDVVMPGESGVTLAATLRRARPGIRVLYMSGFAGEAERSRIPEGAAFLAKPFSPEDLAARVREALDG